jgi:hypothetical protein
LGSLFPVFAHSSYVTFGLGDDGGDDLWLRDFAPIFFRFFADLVFGFGLYAKTTSAIASSAFGTFSGFVIE